MIGPLLLSAALAQAGYGGPAAGAADEHSGHEHAAGNGRGPSSQPVVKPTITGTSKVIVAVVNVRGTDRKPAAAVAVALRTLNSQGQQISEQFATTVENGSATFEQIGTFAGALAVAATTVSGVEYESRPVPLPADGEARPLIETYDVGTDDSQIRFTNVYTETSLWEGSLHVNQEWTIVNDGDATFDASAGVSKTGDAGLLIGIPEGAKAVHGHDMPPTEFETAGPKFLYKGKLRPGAHQSTTVRISFLLEYEDSTLEFVQPASYPIDEAITVVPELPWVRGKQVPNVRLAIGASNQRFESRTTDRGMTFWVAQGFGGGPGQEIRMQVMGLPVRDTRPAWAAMIISAALLLWGVVRFFSDPGPARRSSVPGRNVPLDASARQQMLTRRERLFGRLIELEQARTADRVDEEAYQSQKDDLRRRVIDIDRRLEAHGG